MNTKEAIELIRVIRKQYIPRTVFDKANEALDLAIKALEFQYKMQFGNCDYCKYGKQDSTKYPCCVCGNDKANGYFEMWEEADNDE